MRKLTVLLLALLLTTTVLPAAAAPQSAPPAPDWRAKVDEWVLTTSSGAETEFLVFLRDQADLRGAAGLRSKAEKGEYVYRTLAQHAERTQDPLRNALQRLGVEWRPYWVANMIWVRGNAAVIQALAERADVAHLYANPSVKLDLPALEASNAAVIEAVNGIEWNIAKVNAPAVWQAGDTGEGAVIGGQDTGYYWEHLALKSKYRGWNGTTANHNYNWHDAIHSGGGSCGANAAAPCDDYGHGTHTMGTMVGDDGAGNQVGMAPGARWIGCRNMNQGDGTPATYSECYQWFIAPTDLNGSNPRTDLAPDVINNSWGCPPSEGCNADSLAAVVAAVHAAGIVTVHSAGNAGPGCGTINTPGAIYDDSFTVGGTTNTDNDVMYSNSSRGPVTVDGINRAKPDVAAPALNVRSSLRNGDYGYMSGTSMAGPHVAGLVALLVSASPSLRGQVDAIESAIKQSAVQRTTGDGCGGDSATAVPNNTYGWGRIDAYAAFDRVAPPPAVTDLTVELATPGVLTLSWTAVARAAKYRVSWGATPYFAPGIGCDPAACLEVTTSSLDQAVLGDAEINYSYVVQPVSAYGVVQGKASNRVGEFEFDLSPGE